jgi:putative heme-binding domain-containing protein
MISEIMNQAAAKDARVIELEKSIAGGDAERGRAAFLSGAGACMSCHRVGETGGKIGPDLSHIGRIRTTHDLIEAIAFPGATIARGYETFQITKTDGGTLAGTIPTETADALVVSLADGQQTTVPRASVGKIEPIALSLMPAGLDRAMEPAVFADLVAFLESLR